MNVEKNYSRAVKQYKSKNYNDALKILDKIKRYAPSFRRTYMLEVDIYKELNNYVKEIDAAEKVLLMFNLNDPKEKYLATNAFWFLGHALSQLSLNEEAVKNFRTAAKYATENNSALKALQSAIYVGCYTENFSAADMRALYDEYKKYLPNIIPPPHSVYFTTTRKFVSDFYRAIFANIPYFIGLGHCLSIWTKIFSRRATIPTRKLRTSLRNICVPQPTFGVTFVN